MKDFRAQLAARMPERELQEHVRRAARDLGIRYYHTHDSRHSPKGFPDVVLLCPPHCLYRELKRQEGLLTGDQVAWLNDLASCGYDVGVWRPMDWLAGRVQRELGAMRKRR